MSINLLPEYLRYWRLIKPPFSLTPDPNMIYMSNQHRGCLMRLKYAVISNKGGALLVSENAGDGKTSILSKLISELKSDYKGNCKIAFIDHPTFTPNQMICEIARQFGMERVSTNKTLTLNKLKENLMGFYSKGIKCIVMLDEGQMLCHRPDLLQELRILLNFCVSDSFLLTFIFSGQKPLEGAIKNMPEFWQRLPVRFLLQNLDFEDTKRLIRHRLSAAGLNDREIFTETAYEGIHKFSQGCPRVICTVADLSLLIGYSHSSNKIDFKEVSQACADMNKSDGVIHYFHFLEKPITKNELRIEKEEEPEKKRAAEEQREKEVVKKEEESSPKWRKLKCSLCGGLNPIDSKSCVHCGENFVIICLKCSRENDFKRKTCRYCGLEFEKAFYTKEKEFLEALEKLPLKSSIEDQYNITRRYYLPPDIQMLYVLPYRGLFGSNSKLKIKNNGRKKPETKRCGLIISDKALYLLRKKEMIDIPYQEIKTCRLNIDKKGERVKNYGIDLKSADEQYSLSLPFERKTAFSFLTLLNKYINTKIS